MISVVLVDDQELARAGLRTILRQPYGFDVLAEAADGQAALAEVARVRPDAVVMDIRMPRMDGVEATRALLAADPAARVLVLTTFGEDSVLAAALRAGASGFCLKDAPAEDIQRAVRAVAAGDGWLDPAVCERVLRRYRADPVTDPEAARRLGELTARELDVLKLIGRGLTNAEIARHLVLGEGTVKTHVGRIFTKLAVRDRAAAVVFAFDHGVVRPGEPPPMPGA
ncbi:response regulator [Nonomuraea jiangxiensis]|uniref:DNA-binding response regulator, NarL/FixJ family, contains REC and HTH domains n=1 Tax=Nonomuraea jiangxiensis TaxID=633440 RepID=A0A1G8INJ6_9ACTN|nr:response regulator transcription factor [Nonomuraea jiangxiensis]SDI20529.1 DNA-binding response regulator, NarL/FixJ family, contains REC and HTH domains [Nonomuraea jiangxiensis]